MFNKNYILEAIKNNPRLTVATITILAIAVAFKVFSGTTTPPELSIADMEAKVKAEIVELDTKRTAQIETEMQNIERLKECILSIKRENGSIKPITDCSNRATQSGSIVPEAKAESNTGTVTTKEAKAESNTGTVTTASSVVPERTRLLKPDELFGPTRVSDQCVISQTESNHVRPENGGMFATDIACTFDTPGKGQRAMLFAPDLRDKPVAYKVEYVGEDNLLGSFIQLRVMSGSVLGDESFYLGHTESKLKVGDIVQTGQVIGQMILNGTTTGWHVHFEYRRLSPGGSWASQRYFSAQREKVLDIKRKGIVYRDWKWGDKIYMTNWNVGNVHENDSSPWVGASGVDLRTVNNAIALTVDVRKSLGIKLKDEIVILREGSDKPIIVTVHDEMHARFRNSGPKDCIKREGYCIKGDIPTTFMPGGVFTLWGFAKNLGQP